MASKIADKLTPIEVAEFLEKLAKTEGGEKLRVIQMEAEKRGIRVSLMGAATFRDGELKPYLERLKYAREKSLALAEAVTAGDEDGLLASGRTLLADKINDLLLADVDMGEKEYLALSKALGSLSTSNQGERGLRIRIARYEREEQERREAAELLEQKKRSIVEKGGLSEEAIALMEETLKILS